VGDLIYQTGIRILLLNHDKKNVFAGKLVCIDQRGMQAQFVKTNSNPKIKEKKTTFEEIGLLV